MSLFAQSRRIAWISMLFIFCSPFLYPQIAQKVNGDEIKNVISIIASDDYMGRETGTKGCEMAEEFFAKEYKDLKLKPAGENQSYFHHFTLPFFKVEGGVSLTVDDRKFYYGRSDDYRAEQYSGGGSAGGEIVFLGYGIRSTDPGRNDYENQDVRDKIVLIKRGCPKSDWSKWKDVAIDSIKVSVCADMGARGVLFFEPAQNQQQMPPQAAGPQVNNSLAQYSRVSSLPVFRVDERVARFILRNADLSYSNILRKIDTTTASFATGRTGAMSANVAYDRERKARNVLAMIPGTDSRLKKEAIVIGGHLDHVGTDFDGKINNGADDNASGPSLALGIARAMVKDNFKPKRTIIFTGWSGEEEGLLGAEAWCEKPTWDLDKIVVYFNLDMVGLGEARLNLPGSYYADQAWKIIKENTDSVTLSKVTTSRGGPGGSDHTPFLQKGIPAFAGMTPGPHPNYHQPADDPDKIRSDILQFAGDFIYHAAGIVANSGDNFLSGDRNGIGKFKLAGITNVSPLPYDGFKDILRKKDVDLCLVNISGSKGKPGQENFVSVLKTLDEAFKSNASSKEFSFVQSPLETGGLSYQNKTGLIPSGDLAAFDYDPVFCRSLAKAGLKIGFISPGLKSAQDSTDQTRLMQSLAEGGMALILDQMSANEILNLSAQSVKPVGIIGSDTGVVSDIMAETIKQKNHLFLYRFESGTPVGDIVKNIESLRAKIGDDLISILPCELNDDSYNKLRDIYIQLDKKNIPPGFTGKLFTENLRRFFTKALQETAVRSSGGRPF